MRLHFGILVLLSAIGCIHAIDIPPANQPLAYISSLVQHADYRYGCDGYTVYTKSTVSPDITTATGPIVRGMLGMPQPNNHNLVTFIQESPFGFIDSSLGSCHFAINTYRAAIDGKACYNPRHPSLPAMCDLSAYRTFPEQEIVFTPGVYCDCGYSTTEGGIARLYGTIVFDALGNPNAEFIFKDTANVVIPLRINQGVNMILRNSAQAMNVWIVYNWISGELPGQPSETTIVGNLLAKVGQSPYSSLPYFSLYGQGVLAGRVLSDIADGTNIYLGAGQLTHPRVDCVQVPYSVVCQWDDPLQVGVSSTVCSPTELGKIYRFDYTHRLPLYGGNACLGQLVVSYGPSTQMKEIRWMTDYLATSCSMTICPVDCVQSEWVYSTCQFSGSLTCGTGIAATRTRNTTTAAVGAGTACGPLVENNVPCTVPCPIHCAQNLTITGQCDAQCGIGNRTLIYETTVQPLFGGTPCLPAVRQELCMIQPCPIDCTVTTWQSVTSCDGVCGEGLRTIKPLLTSPEQHGGKPCPGNTYERCPLPACPLVCGYPELMRIPASIWNVDTGITVLNSTGPNSGVGVLLFDRKNCSSPPIVIEHMNNYPGNYLSHDSVSVVVNPPVFPSLELYKWKNINFTCLPYVNSTGMQCGELHPGLNYTIIPEFWKKRWVVKITPRMFTSPPATGSFDAATRSLGGNTFAVSFLPYTDGTPPLIHGFVYPPYDSTTPASYARHIQRSWSFFNVHAGMPLDEASMVLYASNLITNKMAYVAPLGCAYDATESYPSYTGNNLLCPSGVNEYNNPWYPSSNLQMSVYVEMPPGVSGPESALNESDVKHVLSAFKRCESGSCPIDCAVSEWENVSPCTQLCGGGERNQTRHVVYPALLGGTACPMEMNRTVACNIQQCNRDCVVNTDPNSWYDKTACSATCGGGTKIQERNILVEPLGGGAACDPALQYRNISCNTEPCCVINWGAWTPCSDTCYKTWDTDCASVNYEDPLYDPATPCYGPTSVRRSRTGLITTSGIGCDEFRVGNSATEAFDEKPCTPLYGVYNVYACNTSCVYSAGVATECTQFGTQEVTKSIIFPESGTGTPCDSASLVISQSCQPVIPTIDNSSSSSSSSTGSSMNSVPTWNSSAMPVCDASCPTRPNVLLTNNVTCQIDGIVVADTFCNITVKPLQRQEHCWVECVRWFAEEFGQCDKLCGGGNQTRTIHCQDVYTVHYWPDEFALCENFMLNNTHLIKPVSYRSCNTDPCFNNSTDINNSSSTGGAHINQSTIIVNVNSSSSTGTTFNSTADASADTSSDAVLSPLQILGITAAGMVGVAVLVAVMAKIYSACRAMKQVKDFSDLKKVQYGSID